MMIVNKSYNESVFESSSQFFIDKSSDI